VQDGGAFLINKIVQYLMSHIRVIQQYTYEVNSWERLLAFFLVENIYFKTRLSEILSNAEDEELLLSGEQFQEEFLEQDKILLFLCDEIKRQKKLLERDLYEDGELFTEVIKHQKRLRNDIRKEEALFIKIKNTYSDFLSERF